MVMGSQIATEARRYVGTPYAHQGRMLGRALDCVGLVLCVAEHFGLLDADGNPLLRADSPGYSADPTSDAVLQECKRRLIEKPRTAMAEGDVVVMYIPIATHSGIVSKVGGQLYLIHAYNGGTQRCVEHIIDSKWQHRICGVFGIPGVTS